jgi:superfamily I DNA/RNA helicase
MARNIFPNEQNSIDALMYRYKLEASKRHRALDDVLVLVEIFEQLQKHQAKILNLTSLEFYLDIVALGNFIEHKINIGEDKIFFSGGARKLLTAYSKILNTYAQKFKVSNKELRKKINDKLNMLDSKGHLYKIDENIMSKIQAMTLLYDKLPIDEAIANFLSRISLETAQDQLEDINAVSLLTYHAVKGLEFDKVILIGLEKNNMPGFHALRDDSDDDRPVAQKIEEQRRLFYVGMTRAKSELILTTVKNRGGWEYESSPFLKDLDLENILK